MNYCDEATRDLRTEEAAPQADETAPATAIGDINAPHNQGVTREQLAAEKADPNAVHAA